MWWQVGIGLVLLLITAALVTGIWYGSRVERLTISEVEIIGGETIPHDTIRQMADETLTGSYYQLVPKRFAWTYPEEEIVARISRVERIKNVSVERVSGRKVVIAFEEYVPVALWCASLDTQECLFLDHTGYAFAPAPKLQGAAFLRYSDTNSEVTVATDAFAGDFIDRTSELVAAAYNELGLNIRQVVKTGPEDVEYYVAGGGVIKASLRIPAQETFENLVTILESKEFAHLEPGNFKYIDLRFGNKVFVNEEVAPTSDDNGATTSPATTTTSL